MSVVLLEYILEYICNNRDSENKDFKRILSWFDKIVYDFDKGKEDWEYYRKLLLQLQEIRRVYQKGMIFVNNNTKGKRKQFSLINGRIQTLSFLLNNNREEKAIEVAKDDLKYIKKYHSERSYYRYKKRLKELRIEI